MTIAASALIHDAASNKQSDFNIVAYLTSSNTEEIAVSSDTSSLMMDGGLALENPVPTASHPAF